MKTSVCCAAAIIAASVGASCAAIAADMSPIGDWMVKEGYGVIRIDNCSGKMWGIVAWEKSAGIDKENPDPTAFVGGGARTVDEMNIGWLDFYYITDQEYADLQKQNADKSRSTQLQQQ